MRKYYECEYLTTIMPVNLLKIQSISKTNK